jgi:Na+/H+-dicarboxylate symporter
MPKDNKLKISFIFNIVSIIDHYEANSSNQNGVNLLGILVFCLISGNIIGKMGQSGKNLQDLFETISKVFLDMIRIVIWYFFFSIF